MESTLQPAQTLSQGGIPKADVLNRANKSISDALFVCSQLPLRLFSWRGLAPEGTTHTVDMHPDDWMHVKEIAAKYLDKLPLKTGK